MKYLHIIMIGISTLIPFILCMLTNKSIFAIIWGGYVILLSIATCVVEFIVTVKLCNLLKK